MVLKIQKWGNSQGIRIPKSILDELGWKEGNEVKLSVENNMLVIEREKKRRSIVELFEGYSGKYISDEVDWGEPVGKEIW